MESKKDQKNQLPVQLFSTSSSEKEQIRLQIDQQQQGFNQNNSVNELQFLSLIDLQNQVFYPYTIVEDMNFVNENQTKKQPQIFQQLLNEQEQDINHPNINHQIQQENTMYLLQQFSHQINRIYRTKREDNMKNRGRPKDTKKLTETLKRFWIHIKPQMLKLIHQFIINDKNWKLILKLQHISQATGKSWFINLIKDPQFKPYVWKCLTIQQYQSMINSFMNNQDDRKRAYINNRVPLINFCQLEENNQDFRNWYHLQHLSPENRS